MHVVRTVLLIDRAVLDNHPHKHPTTKYPQEVFKRWSSSKFPTVYPTRKGKDGNVRNCLKNLLILYLIDTVSEQKFSQLRTEDKMAEKLHTVYGTRDYT